MDGAGVRPLADRVVVVLADGAEAAVVRTLAGAGASVVLAGRERDRLAVTADEIRTGGGDVLAVPAELTEPGSVQRLVEQTMGAFGRLDAAVNAVSADAAGRTPLPALPVGAYDAALRGMLRGVCCAMKYEIPAMAAGGGGAIVNLIHGAGRRLVVGHAGCAAAASGVVGLTRAAARECAEAGVRANVLVAGGSTTEVAALAVWLCSPLSGYVSGVVFPTDEREDLSRCASA